MRVILIILAFVLVCSFSTRVVLNHAIMVEAKQYCFDNNIRVTEVQLSELFEIFAGEYYIDEDTVQYEITVKE